MEGGVDVVVLRHAPLDGVPGARPAEELGEGLHLGPPVVEEPVVEDAEVPHPLGSACGPTGLSSGESARVAAAASGRSGEEGIEAAKKMKTYLNRRRDSGRHVGPIECVGLIVNGLGLDCENAPCLSSSKRNAVISLNLEALFVKDRKNQKYTPSVP